MLKVGVLTVPFISCEAHYENLQQTYKSLHGLFGDFDVSMHAIINKCNNPEYVSVIKSYCSSVSFNSSNNLALAWNTGIKTLISQGAEYVLVANLDLLAHPMMLQHLLIEAQKNPDAVIWSAQEVEDLSLLNKNDFNYDLKPGTNYSCFLVNRRLFELVGEFDIQFEPAYHEDSDMAYRIHLLNLKTWICPQAKFFHVGQGTLRCILDEKDYDLFTEIRTGMDRSMERYIGKWGGLPGKEVFQTPYNS